MSCIKIATSHEHQRSWPPSVAVMSKYWLHCSQSAKWNHQSRRQLRTVGSFSPLSFSPCEAVICVLIPGSAPPSAQPVHFPPLCISACESLRSDRVSQSSCSMRPDLHSGASAARCSWSSSRSRYFRALTAQDYEFARCSHLHPTLRACHRIGRARLTESSLLTSSADKWDVISLAASSADHWAAALSQKK